MGKSNIKVVSMSDNRESFFSQNFERKILHAYLVIRDRNDLWEYDGNGNYDV